MTMAVTDNVTKRKILIGCGILKKEINWLIKKNNWQLDTAFLDSSLHTDFEKLNDQLNFQLTKYSDQRSIVFYGCCHPLMDKILLNAHTLRTEGQNCVDILLGHDLFYTELANGAFFLLENWALRWEYLSKKTFGDNKEIVRQIFREDRKYVLALKTPCSNDFTNEAEIMAEYVGLPLRWMEVELDNLKSVLNSSLKQESSKLNER